MLHNILVTLSLLVAATSANGKDAAGGFECKYDGNQQEMNACAVRDFKAADAILNERYKALMSALPRAKQPMLQQQQRGWLKRRDPTCKAKAEQSEGGSIWPLEYFGCLQSATERRTKELERWRIE